MSKNEDIIKIKIASLTKEIKNSNLNKKDLENKKDELKRLKEKLAKGKSKEELVTQQVKLELLVEELRKTVCILGKLVLVQNASIRDENLENFLNNKIKELKALRSLGTVKDYLGI